MTATNNTGKYQPAPGNSRPTTTPGAPSAPATRPATPAGNRWTPPSNSARPSPDAARPAPPRAPSQSRPAAVSRPRPLASIELFQKAQALLLALPAQPPVLRKEGVELIAALGAGYLNGDAASLIPALTETRARCGRLLALLTALCPAQLGEFELQLHGLHKASGYFIRYLQEQRRGPK